jgi:hypothetical protein
MNGQEHFRMPSALNISTIPPSNEKRHARLLAFHDEKNETFKPFPSDSLLHTSSS